MEKLPHRLYPERTIESVSEKVENLQKVISGEIPAWEISESDREEIRFIENGLGTQLEEIRAITPRSASFNFNYLNTPEGAVDFQSVVGIELPAEAKNDELKRFMYEHIANLLATSQKELTPLSGRSTKYRENEVFVSLLETMSEDGSVSADAIPSSDSVSMRLTPELDFEKTRRLREFKSQLKLKKQELAESSVDSDYKAVLSGVYDLYQRKVNELIAGRADVFMTIQKKSQFMGEESPFEYDSRSQDRSSGNVPESLARYDKFLTGSSYESDDDGWQKQISSKLVSYADEQERLALTVGLEKNSMIAEKGLDRERLAAETIDSAEVEKYCEETLAHYGLLSSAPASEYSPNRPGPAPDNKWQIIVKDSYQSLAVNGKQKVVKCPNKPQSIERLLSVTIAHEIEGHVLQHNNRSKIPLKLFENIGSDRSSIFAEAGAVQNEGYVVETAFGYPRTTEPHYIRAMVVKLEGGSYTDCLVAFYESAIKTYRQQLEQGIIDEAEFKSECSKKLKLAVNRTGRLFRGGASRSGKYNHLPESKASVYLEQTQLAAALKEAGLDQTLNLTGVNLDALEFLLRAKLLNINDIQSPDFYSLQLWEQMKSQYEISNT